MFQSLLNKISVSGGRLPNKTIRLNALVRSLYFCLFLLAGCFALLAMDKVEDSVSLAIITTFLANICTTIVGVMAGTSHDQDKDDLPVSYTKPDSS